MRARATAAVQSKIKIVAPPVREIGPTRLPARTPVRRGRGPIDMAEAGDPRLAFGVAFGGLAVLEEVPEDVAEEDEAECEFEREPRTGYQTRNAGESLAELEAIVNKHASLPYSYQPRQADTFLEDPASAPEPRAPRAMRDQVVVDHLPLVRAIAIRVHENLPVHVELDDLVHAGIMGLFDASGKYDPEKKVAFSSYAKHRIKGAILDSLRQLDWASRDLRRRHKQVEQVTRDLASTLHRNPTEAEIAAKMGVDVDRWRQMMLDLRNVGLVSASTRGSEHEDLPAPDFPSKPETQPDSMCAREQLRDMLAIAMKVLPERYQRVVRLYYTNELTMKEIGMQLGINESRVSQIHKSALEKMAAALQQAGIHSSQAF